MLKKEEGTTREAVSFCFFVFTFAMQELFCIAHKFLNLEMRTLDTCA